MSKPIYSLDLSPRENRHIQPRLSRDVRDILGVAVLAFLCYLIAMLVGEGLTLYWWLA